MQIDNQTTKEVGRAIRLLIIVGQFIGGILLSLGIVFFGLLIFFGTQEDRRNGAVLVLFFTAALLGVVLSSLQLYKRLSFRKRESTNLAYQSTDGNVAVNKPSGLDRKELHSELSDETVKNWAGPVFSNQNTHVVWLAVDNNPNTENTLILSENYFIGLLIGPDGDSSSISTTIINLIPVGSTEKNAYGAFFDNGSMRQSIEEKISEKKLEKLFQDHGIFVISMAEINDVFYDNYTLKIKLKNGKQRTWVGGKQDDQLVRMHGDIKSKLGLSTS